MGRADMSAEVQAAGMEAAARVRARAHTHTHTHTHGRSSRARGSQRGAEGTASKCVHRSIL